MSIDLKNSRKSYILENIRLVINSSLESYFPGLQYELSDFQNYNYDVISNDIIQQVKLIFAGNRETFELDSHTLVPQNVQVPGDDVSIPENWWEAFKERWYPKWLLSKYPVEYLTFNTGFNINIDSKNNLTVKNRTYKLKTENIKIKASTIYPEIKIPELAKSHFIYFEKG